MSSGATSAGAMRSAAESSSSDPNVQRTARAMVVALHSAVRAIRLYPVENQAVQKALSELSLATARLTQLQEGCELRRVGDYLFVNDTRLRLTLDNYAAVAYVLGLLREAGIGGISVTATTESRDWIVLLAFLQAPPLDFPEEERRGQLEARLAQSNVTCFVVSAPADEQGTGDAELDQKERARQTYVRSLDVTRE